MQGTLRLVTRVSIACYDIEYKSAWPSCLANFSFKGCVAAAEKNKKTTPSTPHKFTPQKTSASLSCFRFWYRFNSFKVATKRYMQCFRSYPSTRIYKLYSIPIPPSTSSYTHMATFEQPWSRYTLSYSTLTPPKVPSSCNNCKN
jgi:hypothetical protein